MNFNVIIPVFNGGAKIERTINSIILQTSIINGNDTFQCFVVDAASTDDTLQRIRSINDNRINIISERDNGMYDALSKGFKASGSGVTCYLGAGEIFDLSAFQVISQVFDTYREVNWLKGRDVTRNSNLNIINSRLPPPYYRHLIDCGMYGTRLSVIQQESTFWRAELTNQFDLEYLKNLKLAGDFYLWKCLAKKNELYIVNTHLGSFTSEPGQLSSMIPGAYKKELRLIRRSPNIFERFSAIILRQMEKRFYTNTNSKRIINFDHKNQTWRLNNN
jgi:glycosyltransferase involved in cell wall biosynthesis